jgi:hypothetical protein
LSTEGWLCYTVQIRVVTSVQNLFPHVFVKVGSDESQFLLGALSSPDKWDNGTHSSEALN